MIKLLSTHVNLCVFDSKWKASDAFELDRNQNVEAWVKNDHLGFEIFYTYEGVIRKYRSDFIIRLRTGEFLVLETKGQDTEQDKTKRRFLDEWVTAVNGYGGFGRWRWAVTREPGEIARVLAE
jgi:type III restriction enzyme